MGLEARLAPNATIRQLRAFVAVARSLSFTAAARTIGLTQPAISLNIQQLEAQLDALLLDRSSRRITLTKAGANFLPVAERLLSDFDSALNDARAMSDPARGHVFISCPTSLTVRFLLPVLKRLAKRMPGIRVSLREDDGEPAHKLVRDGAVDFAVSGSWEPDPDLSFTRMFTDPCCVICPKDHPLAHASSLKVDDLAGFRFIASTPGTATRRLFELAVTGARSKVEVTYEVAHLLTIFELVAAGLGISVLPNLAAQLAVAHQLVCIPLSKPMVWREVGLIARKGRTLSATARLFWEGLLSEGSELEASGMKINSLDPATKSARRRPPRSLAQ